MHESASALHPMLAERVMHPAGCAHCHHAGAKCCPNLQGCGSVITLLALSVINVSTWGNPGEKPLGHFLLRIASLAYIPPLRPPAA
jgi:hypothetical protein